MERRTRIFSRFESILAGILAFLASIYATSTCRYVSFHSDASADGDANVTDHNIGLTIGFGLWTEPSGYEIRSNGYINVDTCHAYEPSSTDRFSTTARVSSILCILCGGIFILCMIFTNNIICCKRKVTERITASLGVLACYFQGLTFLLFRSPTVCTDNQFIAQLQSEINANESVQLDFDKECSAAGGFLASVAALMLWYLAVMRSCVIAAGLLQDDLRGETRFEELEDFDPDDLDNAPEVTAQDCKEYCNALCRNLNRFLGITSGVVAFTLSLISVLGCKYVMFHSDQENMSWEPASGLGFSLWSEHSEYKVLSDGSIEFNSCQKYESTSVDSALTAARVFSILSLVFGGILVLGLFAISTKITKRINAVLALLVCVFQALPILVLRSPTLCTDNQIVRQIQYEIYKNENIQINFDNKCVLSDGLYGCFGGLTLWVVVFLTCCMSVASDVKKEREDDIRTNLDEPLALVPVDKEESSCCKRLNRIISILLGIAAFTISFVTNFGCEYVFFNLDEYTGLDYMTPMGFGLWGGYSGYVRSSGSFGFDYDTCQLYDAASVDSALTAARVFSILSLVFGAVFILCLIFIKIARINVLMGMVLCVIQGLPLLIFNSKVCTNNQIVKQVQSEINAQDNNIKIDFYDTCVVGHGAFGCIFALILWFVVSSLASCLAASDFVKAKKMTEEEEEEEDDDFDSLKEPLAPVPEYLANISPDIAAHYGLTFTEDDEGKPFEIPNSPSSNEKKESNCCRKFTNFCIAFVKFAIIIFGVAAFALSTWANFGCDFVYFEPSHNDDTTIWAPYTYMGFGLWSFSWYSVREDGSIAFDLDNCQAYDSASVDSALIMARVFSILSLVLGAVFIVMLCSVLMKQIQSNKAFIFIVIIGVVLCVFQVLPFLFMMKSSALCTDNKIVAQAESEIKAEKNITSQDDLLEDECKDMFGYNCVLAMIFWGVALLLMCFVKVSDFMKEKKVGGNDRSSTRRSNCSKVWY